MSTDPRGNHPRFMAMLEDAIAAVPPKVIGTGFITVRDLVYAGWAVEVTTWKQLGE